MGAPASQHAGIQIPGCGALHRGRDTQPGLLHRPAIITVYGLYFSHFHNLRGRDRCTAKLRLSAHASHYHTS